MRDGGRGLVATHDLPDGHTFLQVRGAPPAAAACRIASVAGRAPEESTARAAAAPLCPLYAWSPNTSAGARSVPGVVPLGAPRPAPRPSARRAAAPRTGLVPGRCWATGRCRCMPQHQHERAARTARRVHPSPPFCRCWPRTCCTKCTRQRKHSNSSSSGSSSKASARWASAATATVGRVARRRQGQAEGLQRAAGGASTFARFRGPTRPWLAGARRRWRRCRWLCCLAARTAADGAGLAPVGSVEHSSWACARAEKEVQESSGAAACVPVGGGLQVPYAREAARDAAQRCHAQWRQARPLLEALGK